MKGFAKAILISMFVSIAFILFTNLIYFFPWYMTLVYETFNLSQVAASDNYVKQSYFDDIEYRLENKPIFRERRDEIEINITNEYGNEAVGYDDETYYSTLTNKPYLQRGHSITVELRAVYPLSISIWGNPVEKEIPVSFTLKTTGLKHYKDLDYYE